MKEYSIEIICNGGKPYLSNVYRSYNDCLNALYIMIDLERERNRPYFVNLENFDNEYQRTVIGKYFSILEREVTGWNKIISENKRIQNEKIFRIY